ncbi:hypothetical protein BMS3Bbin03_02900 [bacterium BMS3Bbin03]|nr:hypothetical protein BMS3Bbin03_02900 [bacterium BMS3Bbin03]
MFDRTTAVKTAWKRALKQARFCRSGVYEAKKC